MSRTASTSTGRRFGLQRVCRAWKRPRSTVYHHRRLRVCDPATPPKRPGPQGPCDDATLLGHIRKVLADSPFHGEGYRKVWARLRFRKVRTSKERVRRLMREHGLQAPSRAGHAHGPKAHDRTIIPKRLNAVYILKDQLKALYDFRSRTWAKRALDQWCRLAAEVDHPLMRRFIRQLNFFEYGILNHCDYPMGTSRLEGVNNKIKVIKRKAYGFHDPE
jgi:hypothetical protein